MSTIAMLVGVASLVERPDRRQGSRSLTNPEKPTHTGVALTVSHPKTRHADHRPLGGAGWLQMQVLPRLDQDAMPFLVLAFPYLIGGSVRLGRIAFEALAIEASGPRVCLCEQERADTRRDFSPVGSACHRPPPSLLAEMARCRSCDQQRRWLARRKTSPKRGTSSRSCSAPTCPAVCVLAMRRWESR